MKISIVLAVVMISNCTFMQASDHLAILVAGSLPGSGATTPTSAAKSRFVLGGSSGRNTHRRSASSGTITVGPQGEQKPCGIIVSVTDRDLPDSDKKREKDFRKTSAVEQECNTCLPGITIGIVLLCETLILLGVL